MTDNVIEWTGITRLDLPAERILQGALAADLKSVVIIGWDSEDDFVFAASLADGGDVLWLLEMAKKKLLELGE